MIGSAKIDNSWMIAESFFDPDGSDMMEALQGGCNLIRLIFTKTFSQGQIEEAFAGIFTDMVTIYAEGKDESINNLEKFLSRRLDTHLFTFKNEDFEAELINFLQKAKTSFENAGDFENYYVVFASNMDYLQNICKIKAIRILWAHLIESFGSPDKYLSILCQAGEFHNKRSVEEDYIFGVIQMMSSIIAGGDAIEICTPQKSTHSKAFRKRITRNLHHLASLEGKMDLVHDPLRGSYFVEEESNQYARNAWNKFTL